MKVCTRLMVVMLLLALTCGVTQAAVVSFSPRFQTVELGDQAQVDIIVSDTGGAYVGAYDFFVDFDATILALSAVDLGTGLGGPLDSLSSVTSSSGRINVSEVSLLFDLGAVQSGADPFVLFTLTFQTRATGVAALDFRENILGVVGGFLGDDLGRALDVSRSDSGSITVITPPPTGGEAPEPGSLALAGLALLAAARARRVTPARR